MKRGLKNSVVGLVIAVAFFCGAHVIWPQTKPEGAKRSRPKLVVVLVVDQMRADYVNNFHSQWTGGLARLVNQGAWFTNARYPYLTTVTCAGHATISTGRVPEVHGIVANSWYDREARKSVTCTADPKVTDVAYDRTTSGGDSAWRLEAPTFSDELREQGTQPVRVVSFSLKARAAIMLAGHKADAIAWFDAATGAWASSTAYGNSAAVGAYVNAHPVAEDFGKTWAPVPPDEKFVFNVAPTGRQKIAGWGLDFPHPLNGGDATSPGSVFYSEWEASPYSSEYMVRMADTTVDSLKLGQSAGTDYLALGLSSLDVIGHATGPYSHEVQDTLSELDRSLGELFEHLDRTLGAGNYVVALSADHGVAPLPEEGASQGLDGGRASDRAIAEAAENVLDTRWGGSGHVASTVEGDLSLAPGDYDHLRGDSDAMKEVLTAILQVPGVARVLRSDELAARADAKDAIWSAARRSHFAGRSGDLIIVLKPYWIYSEPSRNGAPGLGTTHGSAYDYDQRVPVILYGWGVRHGEFARAAAPMDIAPTLADLCGVRMPGSDGRVLREALQK
jgi:predicted AlkP superfamily pyrophosphatase or phosphodiesterase